MASDSDTHQAFVVTDREEPGRRVFDIQVHLPTLLGHRLTATPTSYVRLHAQVNLYTKDDKESGWCEVENTWSRIQDNFELKRTILDDDVLGLEGWEDTAVDVFHYEYEHLTTAYRGDDASNVAFVLYVLTLTVTSGAKDVRCVHSWVEML